MTEDESHGLSRRSVVKAAGIASASGMVGLAGCTGGDGGDGGGGDGGSGGEATEGESGDGGSGSGSGSDGGSGSNTLEIVHWWTAGGEQEALNALLEGFQEAYPDAEVQNNPAPGGAGSALDTAIKNRVLNENPPSTFQIWPGNALAPYTEADLLTDLSDVWGQNDMENAYLDGVQTAAKAGTDAFVSVPINIHRLNNLFYNKSVVESAGVDPSSIGDPSALMDAMDTVAEQTDAVPMAHQTQSPWSTLQLWETILIGEQGVGAFETFVSGDVGSVESAVKSALTRVKEYSNHFPEDAGSISWDQGNSMVVNGEAAFIHQGDWAAGQYNAADSFEYDSAWGNVAFPGTDGIYSLVMDSFVFPTNNPSPDTTEKFLTYCGTKDAQRRFNTKKGSIPPRTDVSMDEFGPFLQAQSEDFANSSDQPATIAHGTAVRPEVKSNIEGAFASFLESYDVNSTYDELVSAFDA